MHGLAGAMTGIGRVLGAIALALWLVGCGVVGSDLPPEIVQRAIALQLEQTQQELGQVLRLAADPPTIAIKKVRIRDRQRLTIQDLPAYQVTGTCDYTVNRPDHTFPQTNTPFEVFLQRQSEGKTWRAAYVKLDDTGEPIWVTQRIPTDIYE